MQAGHPIRSFQGNAADRWAVPRIRLEGLLDRCFEMVDSPEAVGAVGVVELAEMFERLETAGIVGVVELAEMAVLSGTAETPEAVENAGMICKSFR